MNKVLTIAGVTLMALLNPSVALAQSQSRSSIEVSTSVADPAGYVTFYLFDEQGWRLQHPNKWASESPEHPLQEAGEALGVGSGIHSAMFHNLPAGRYAIAAYRDLDKDCEYTFSKDGAPLEPIGFSNNPSPPSELPPPSEPVAMPTFEQISFHVEEGQHVEISIELIGQ